MIIRNPENPILIIKTPKASSKGGAKGLKLMLLLRPGREGLLLGRLPKPYTLNPKL